MQVKHLKRIVMVSTNNKQVIYSDKIYKPL